MEPKRVIVTYCDESGNWANIEKDLTARLPLRNLVWKPSNNRATRNIPILDVDLKRFSPETSKNLPPVTLLQNPYLNLYFVNCEDNETYRTTVRQHIKDWLQLVTQKKNQEWLIVHISSQENARAAKVAQVRMADTEMSEMELWADFTEKVKEGIVTSFDQNVLTFEEDIRRLDSQRQMPGWNYCKFFILKEGLTNAYEMMNLHDDALRQYDELEASFFQILRDNALTWYGKFGGMQEGDEDANLLDLNRKPYRDLIMQNTISVFDFRTYLFGRQCNLLFRLRRPVEICHRALIFIPQFARTVREHMLNHTENFLESWIYSACMCIVNECDETVPLANDDSHMMIMLDGAKAELLQLARQQLDKLGIQHGRLPKELPFTMSLGYENTGALTPSEGGERRPLSKDLLEAVSTDETFDALYMSVSARAIKGFDGSGRHRSSLLLHGDVAALQYNRKKYAEAARILESITWRYGHSHWTVLENELVIKHANCLRELGDTVKYAQTCLTLLRNMDDLKDEDTLYYTNELFKTVTSKELKQEIYHEFAPMFTVKVVSVVEILPDDDGSYLEIMIDNKLPKEIEFNKLSVRMVSGEVDELWFNIRHGVMKPGKNNFRVACETSASGTYVLEKVHLKTGKLVFLYDFLQESRKRIFRVDSHPKVLKATISSPQEMELGKPSTFVVHVSSGRNKVSEASLSLFPASEGIAFLKVPTLTYTKQTSSSDDKTLSPGEITLETHEAISLPAFGPNETLAITVPYETFVDANEHLIKLAVHYLTPNSRRHTFTLSTSIDTVLPLQVSHSIIWRDECLRDEVEKALTSIVETDLVKAQLEQHVSFVNMHMKSHLLKSVDYMAYGMSDDLELPPLDVPSCEAILAYHDPKTRETLIGILNNIFSVNKHLDYDHIMALSSSNQPLQISFPIPLPTSQVLTTVEIIVDDAQELTVGTPATFKLLVKHSAYWNPIKDQEQTYDFYYDILVDYENWLLSGHKKRLFTAKPGENTTHLVSLVPLKTGPLHVPKITITSASGSVYNQTSYVNEAEQVLIKPRTTTSTFFIDQQRVGMESIIDDVDDFESFEFIDYTTSGPWERFITQIEDCLKQWGLVKNSRGVFNPCVMPTTDGCVDLDRELALAIHENTSGMTKGFENKRGAGDDSDANGGAKPQSKVYQHDATVTLDSTAYTLSYRYHPAKARIAAGVERIDLDFLPTMLEGVPHHCLHRWTSLTHILVLSPAPGSDTPIIDLGSAKLLLSSFAIAFQNMSCNIPVFVPTGQPANMTYTGLSIQPQLGNARDMELGLEEDAEDQAIEVRFNTVLVPYPPAQYTNLSGILELFIERMGVEDEFAGSSVGDDGPEGYSQEVKEQIFVSGLFSYQLDKWYGDNWRHWADQAGDERSQSNDGRSTITSGLPFGPTQNPLKSLRLVARFASAPSTVYLDSKNLTDMDANQANIWIINATFKADDYGLLSGMLEDIISSWNMEVSSSAEASNKHQESDKDQSSYISMLRRGARLIQGSIAMVDAADVDNIVKTLLSISTPSQPLQEQPEHTRTLSDESTIRVVSAAELGLHFRHATTVPYGSFLWKMLQQLIDVLVPNSHISYPTTFMGFLKAVWAELLKRFSEHWEQKRMIPWVDIYSEPSPPERRQGDESILSRDEQSQEQKSRGATIDLRFTLLHQKLAMINCCIAREHDRNQEEPARPNAAGDNDSSGFISAPSSSALSLRPLRPPMESSTSNVSAESTEYAAIASNRSISNTEGDRSDERGSTDEEASLNRQYTTVPELGTSDQNPSKSPTSDQMPAMDTESDIKKECATNTPDGLMLLETGAPLIIPRLQDPELMTEDMVQEQEALFEGLGSSADAAKTRATMQSAQLLSDMSAFKAANPGCVLGDFIRWHSPKDWDEDKRRMSARMAEHGNIWQELWETSDPVPASQQKPLFDHHSEAQKALSYLKGLTGRQLFVQLFPTICLLAYDALASHPVSTRSQQVATTLQELAQVLTDFHWDELPVSEKNFNLKPILTKFRHAESTMGRAIALINKLPDQYSLCERILQESESVVEDGTERECVFKLFTTSAGNNQASFPKPNCREFVMETFDPTSSSGRGGLNSFVSSGDMMGWHARPLQRRMYACFKDKEVRIVEAIAKDGMFM
ncbi:hypothetical protein BGZ51_008181 [Haplosporangium sp. Z 767]|nr:hypothetical protein BGZ51_008181 [Haplosporangium sp. Z 767]